MKTGLGFLDRVIGSLLALTVLGAVACVGALQMPTSSRSTGVIARMKPSLTAALGAKNLRFGSLIYIRIFKAESELELWVADGDRFVLFRTYPICAFSGELGPKLREGDRQSPEGFYSVRPAQLNPASQILPSIWVIRIRTIARTDAPEVPSWCMATASQSGVMP